uniref:MARVEL domain-containing protein n=1 Tax=Tetranychus urticae TaxID=32264 RepID=T1KFA2_TETUR
MMLSSNGANASDLSKVTSKTKLFLLILIGIQFTLSLIEFVLAIVNGYVEAILITVISVCIDGTLLSAIFMQWKSVLRVFRTIIIVIVIICIIASLAGILVLVGGEKLEKHQVAEDLITVIIGSLIYSLLAYLLGKYLDQISVSEQFSYST